MRYLPLILLLALASAQAQITYPVSTNDFFSFRIGTNEWVRNQRWKRSDGMPLTGTNANLQILREAQAAIPTYTNTSHKLDDGTWVHNTNANTLTATFTFTPVVLSVAESNAVAAGLARGLQRTNLANSIATLRTWSSQAAGTTVTSTNVVAVTQTTITRLGIIMNNLADLLEVQRITP